MESEHANNMVLWDAIACQRGHRVHRRRQVHINLGDNDSYWDYPRIPARFRDEFDMQVWDWRKYAAEGPYCPGHDVVSETIYDLGVWEQCETAVMLMCLEAAGVGASFIDFGCQVGWYSVLAGRAGLDVIAFDADPECVTICEDNLLGASFGEFAVRRERIDENFGHITIDVDRPIVVKIDLEGAEQHAVAALSPIIDHVQYMLIEMSPCFNDSYLQLARDLIGEGFEPYEIPPRGDPPITLDRLADMRPFHLGEAEVNDIPTWWQKNVLFARGGL